MLRILLVRHGATLGNLEKKYIGSTDESLSNQGREELRTQKTAGNYPCVDRIFASPMIRCRQTASILFPGQPQEIIEDLKECDFGEFENKNYRELKDHPLYQTWVDSGGTIAFPGGEHPQLFRRRCVLSFQKTVQKLTADNHREDMAVAFVVHGGTIMSIMAELCTARREYFDWQVSNGEGYLCIDKEGKLELCFSITS